ncbi:hypothetical protein GCM10010531_28900 [Blastococcus jejuensis]|uniref:Uncharacterized protein n=1 Tax=Blastococcus jejuensis TaxID=351224 RepID=A0ABP6PCW7_9ACTN
MIVTAEPGSAQVGTASGGAAPSARHASATRTAKATSPAGHQRCELPPRGRRAEGRFRAPPPPVRRRAGRRRRAPEACTAVWEVDIAPDCRSPDRQCRGARGRVGEAPALLPGSSPG